MAIWLKICGGGLLCVIAVLLLKSAKSETVVPLQWTGIVVMCGAGVALLQPVISFLGTLAQQHGVGEVVSVLLRGLGVALLTQLCADLCRQSGEGLLASGVEFAGRAELLVMTLPQLQTLLSVVQSMLGLL